MVAEPSALLAALDSQFLLDKPRLDKIRAGFLDEEERGLRTSSDTISAMIPSYVNSLPTGNEVGTFLSLDLGGTNCRVAAVQLLGRGKVEVLEAKRAILDDLRVGAVTTLFDWMTDLVVELVTVKGRHLFLPEELAGDKTLYLGVTWSFPVNQTEINRGTILPMGKGFTLDITSRDLVELFHEAFDRKKLNLRVSAILNDTVGTLVAHAYQNPLTRIGVIVATGTNAAYIEEIDNIVKLPQEYRDSHRGGSMIINTEIDIFGSPDYLPLTEFDLRLVANSAQPDFQYYEKMMSGMYIGELARLVMLDFIGQACLFDGVIPGGLEVPYSFQTIHMSAIESDFTAGHSKTIDFFTDTYDFAKKPSEQDVDTIRHIVKTISTRSARLTAAATSSMIEKQNLHLPSSTEPIVIGINGSVYEHYPFYGDRVVEGFRMLYPERVHERIKVELARDGGTVGAALVAMLCAGRT